MTAEDTVNRVFREFKRYTGDGLPNEPVGAPLPVGDPSSGVHNPKKSELRSGLLTPLQEMEQIAEDAEAARDLAGLYAGEAAAQANMPIFDTVVGVTGINIPAPITGFWTKGYNQVGVGGALYRKFAKETEAQAVIDRINAVSAIALTQQKEWAINRAISRLKKGGLLAVGKLGALLDLGGAGQADEAAGLVEWIRPTTVTPTLGGAGTIYTAGKGMQFSGTSYVTLGVTFDTLPGVTLNEAHAGVFIVGTGVEDYTQFNDNPMIGGGSRLAVHPNNLAGGVDIALNTNTPVAVGTQVVGRAGHTIANRDSAGTVQAFRDGELAGETASAVQSVPVSHPTIGWWSTPNLFSTDTVGFAHFGGNLTAEDAALLYDVLVEYRHLILSGANAGGLIQSADGAWWELGEGFVRTPYHYGADESDDTQAFRDLCALQQEAWVPKPKSFFKVEDEVIVLARVRGDRSRVRMQVNTAFSRCFDMRDRSKLVGITIDHEVITATPPVEGGQHCAVLLGRFHGTMSPVRDVEIDVVVNCLTAIPAAVYTIGNVSGAKISYDVYGRHINGAAFLAHWGIQIDPDGVTEHSLQRPRNGHIVRGVGKSLVTAGHRGFYFSGVANWRVDHLEAHNFTAPMGVAPGDKPAEWDDLAFNDTRQELLANLSFGTVILENPAGTACRMWGRTAFVNGKRWYSTDLDSQASTLIENLQIRRGPATTQAGDEAIMLDIDIGANIDILKLSITHAPNTPSSVLDVLEPMVRINGGRNIKIAGRIVGRVGTRVLTGHNIELAIDAERQGTGPEASSASVGVRVDSELVTGTLTAAVAAGDTSISLLRSPATHIVPGMEFEFGGIRYVFASSQAGNNLLDDNVVMEIFPAPAAIADGSIFTVLGGVSHLKLRGSEEGFYRGQWYSSTDPRIPHDIDVVPNITYSWDDHIEIDGGCGYRFHGGVMDFGNRRNDAGARDLRMNSGRDLHVTGVRFAPSPGSRLTIHHIYADASTSGIVARDNYGYGTASGVMFAIPVTGADGIANVNDNFEA